MVQSFESLVTEIVSHLSVIRRDNALFTATTWPAFIAGAETDSLVIQNWVKARFEELWLEEPWGVIKGALGVLESIWKNRKVEVIDTKQFGLTKRENSNGAWLEELRNNNVNWLII